MEVAYVFEQGHKYRAQADRMLEKIGQFEDVRKYFRYRLHLFEYKEREYGLQAADLYAWTITKAKVSDGVVPQAFKPFVQPIMRWATENGDKCRLHAFTGKTLDRFFDELSSAIPTATVQTKGVQQKRGFK
jgi:hypothetical protein